MPQFAPEAGGEGVEVIFGGHEREAVTEGEERRRRRAGVAMEGRNVARVRPPVLAVGRHLIYCFNYIRIYR